MNWQDDVRNLLPLSGRVAPDAGLPAGPGAYALMIRLGRPVDIPWKGGARRFSAGRYIYAGSARGPGGIRARVNRHLRRDKTVHWHVDHLTTVADRIDVLAIEGGTECAIVAALLTSGVCRVVLKGFGSSDCRDCLSHLLAWEGD
ncbi:MAG: GIY-YIG nuclease family protein [Novosphingobium sp.]|jgi:Uri superfamily endonuclease|nr:GIY-YIG nuclease family protein [Novosphingobium sp.]